MVWRSSTCSSGVKPGGWCCGFRLDRPGAGGDAGGKCQRRDCARVSRDLSAVLDVEDVLPVAYTLEVSSPGSTARCGTRRDYRRFAGRRAKLVMREAVDGQKFVKGILGGVSRTRRRRPHRRRRGRRHRVPIGVITRANLEVEF